MTKKKEYLSPMPISTEIILFVKKDNKYKRNKIELWESKDQREEMYQ